MADPIRWQHLQTGSLSAERQYQLQRNLPDVQRRMFEAEVLKQFEISKQTIQEAEKAKQNKIDQERKEGQSAGREFEQKARAKKQHQEEDKPNAKIIKGEDGTIKHLDVKI